jgi:hypothetical protein
MDIKSQEQIRNLCKEYSALKLDYNESVRRDDPFSVKRKILTRMRTIERQIIILKQGNVDVRYSFGSYSKHP